MLFINIWCTKNESMARAAYDENIHGGVSQIPQHIYLCRGFLPNEAIIIDQFLLVDFPIVRWCNKDKSEPPDRNSNGGMPSSTEMIAMDKLADDADVKIGTCLWTHLTILKGDAHGDFDGLIIPAVCNCSEREREKAFNGYDSSGHADDTMVKALQDETWHTCMQVKETGENENRIIDLSVLSRQKISIYNEDDEEETMIEDSNYMCDVDEFHMANSKECQSCSPVCGLQTSKNAKYCQLICPHVCGSNRQPVSATFILQDGTNQADFEEMKMHATSVVRKGLAEVSCVEFYALENNNMEYIGGTVLNGKEKTWRDDLNLFSHRRTSNVDREPLDIKVVEKFINITMDKDKRRKMAQILFIYSASDVKNVKRLQKKTFVFVKAGSGGWKGVATDSKHIHVGGWDSGVEQTDLQVICKGENENRIIDLSVLSRQEISIYNEDDEEETMIEDSNYMCDFDEFRMANSKECQSCSPVCGLQTSKDAEYCRLICPRENENWTTDLAVLYIWELSLLMNEVSELFTIIEGEYENCITDWSVLLRRKISIYNEDDEEETIIEDKMSFLPGYKVCLCSELIHHTEEKSYMECPFPENCLCWILLLWKSQNLRESLVYQHEPEQHLFFLSFSISNFEENILSSLLAQEPKKLRIFSQVWKEEPLSLSTEPTLLYTNYFKLTMPCMESGNSLIIKESYQLSSLCLVQSLIQHITQLGSHIMNAIISCEVLKLHTIFFCLFDKAVTVGLAQGLLLEDLFSSITAKGNCNATVKHEACLIKETSRDSDRETINTKLFVPVERELEHVNNYYALIKDFLQRGEHFVKIHKTSHVNSPTRPEKCFDSVLDMRQSIRKKLAPLDGPETIGSDYGFGSYSGAAYKTFKEVPRTKVKTSHKDKQFNALSLRDGDETLSASFVSDVDTPDETEEKAHHALLLGKNDMRICLDDALIVPHYSWKPQADAGSHSEENQSESIGEDSTEDEICLHVIKGLRGHEDFNFSELKKVTKKPGSVRPDLSVDIDDFTHAVKSSIHLPVPQIDITVGILETSLAPHFEPLSDILKKIADGDSPSPHVTMRYELLRLCTLRNYPRHNKPFLIRLAGAGFYFAGVEDEVICYCCGVRRQGWVSSDIPLDVHKRLSSNCRYIGKNNEVNIPVPNVVHFNLEKFSVLDSIPAVTSEMYPRPAAEDVANDAATPGFLTETSRSGESRPVGTADASRPNTNPAVGQMPKHPQYAIKATRLASFNGWPDNVKQSPEVLADAGFYYAGFGDCVRCFFCGTGLRHWAEEDNAFIEHARWSRNCFYLKQKKGQEFINLVSLAVQYTQDEQQPSRSAGDALRRNEAEQVLLSDPAQSVLEMGYDSRIIKLAIDKLLSTVGRNGITSTVLMEKVLEIEEEESTATVTAGMSDLQVSVNNETAQNVSFTSGTPGPSQGVVTSGNSGDKTSVSSGTSAGAVTSGSLGTSSGAKGGPKDVGPSSLGSNGAEKKPKSSDKASNEKIDSKTLKAENEKMREQTLCKVCLDKTVCIVFLPCGHLVTCGECAPAMRKCPICRALVKGTVRTYMN